MFFLLTSVYFCGQLLFIGHGEGQLAEFELGVKL